jgi:CHASE3 domain sensor protein
MSAPNEPHLIRAHDALTEANDFVEAIYLAALGLDDSSQTGAFSRIALMAQKRIEKAQRQIERYREKDAAAKSAIAEPAAT